MPKLSRCSVVDVGVTDASGRGLEEAEPRAAIQIGLNQWDIDVI